MARELSAARAPAAPRVLMANVATADLRTELNCHHEGKDRRITIECQLERHPNLKGHNLEKDFGSLALAWEAVVAHGTPSSSSPAATRGCMALAPHLCMVV
jgi:hypothetical protein